MPTTQPENSSPRVLMMGRQSTDGGAYFAWHMHAFDELCLVTDSPTTIGHAGRRRATAAQTLYLFRQGEKHGFWNTPDQRPRLEICHFQCDRATWIGTGGLIDLPPAQRIWRLHADQVEQFRWYFSRLQAETLAQRPDGAVAEASWLRLMLVTINRWRGGVGPSDLSGADDDLATLHAILRTSKGSPADALAEARARVANYDSLRHRFKRVFGCSPRDLATRAIMQRARHLLAETDLTIKQIAARVGYRRQHEFARAFHRFSGQPPTRWRSISAK
jgi:hypothetical protein